MLLTLVTFYSIAGRGQAPGYHWEINGVAMPGATSIAFVSDYQPKRDSVLKQGQVLYAGKMLYRYKYYHMTGNLMEIAGAGIAFINLLEMNRTTNPPSNYMPMYIIGGGLAAAGYILNAWIAPGFITRAGMVLQGNSVCINLD